MKTNNRILMDIMDGVAVSLTIKDPDDGKLNGLANYLKHYVSQNVRSAISVASGTESNDYQMTLHIPCIEETKRTLVVSALEQSELTINRQQTS